jgi:hypothetical protein
MLQLFSSGTFGLLVVLTSGTAAQAPPQQLRFGPYLVADGEIFDSVSDGVVATVQRPVKTPSLVV